MKKSTKTKLAGRLASLGLMMLSLSAVSAHAQGVRDYGQDYGADAPLTQQPGEPGDAYSLWCDQVTQQLNEAQATGWGLYRRQQYSQARVYILDALQRAVDSMRIPGSAFRPATFREIERTIQLINALDVTNPSRPNGNIALKAKTIAYVALQRISFISYVKDAVDVAYNIPCHRRRCGYGYEDAQFEAALANAASAQLSRAQDYSSIVGANGMVYPINDTPYYFVIVSKAARWAAEDLSTSLFNTSFSCAITNLQTLGSRAASYQAMFGDVTAVQKIHCTVEDLIREMSYRPYGCGYRFGY